VLADFFENMINFSDDLTIIISVLSVVGGCRSFV